MNKLARTLQTLTLFLLIILLVLVVLDAFTHAWVHKTTPFIASRGLRVCFSNLSECSQLWKDMFINNKIAMVLLLSTIPVIITSILIMTLAMFTRVIRKRTSIVILIITSWLVFLVLVAVFALRIGYEQNKFVYTDGWQTYVTVASVSVSLLINQLIAFGGWIRPMTTMLSFEGHFQRYDYPRMSNIEKNMVSVRELDNF